MKQGLTWDYQEFSRFCGDAAGHYEKSAPQVETWLDQVLDRIANGSVTLRELTRVQFLYQDGQWLDANGAGNVAYKAMSEYGTLPSNITISY